MSLQGKSKALEPIPESLQSTVFDSQLWGRDTYVTQDVTNAKLPSFSHGVFFDIPVIVRIAGALKTTIRALVPVTYQSLLENFAYLR